MIMNPAVLSYGRAAEAVLDYLDQHTTLGEAIVEFNEDTRADLIESISNVMHDSLYKDTVYKRGYDQAISEIKIHMDRFYNEVK